MSEILIIGGDGQIGRALKESFGPKAIVTTRRRETLNSSRIFLDLANLPNNLSMLPKVETFVIVAGITRFFECRNQTDLARKINVLSPERLAYTAIERGCRVIFLSTAAVLDCKIPHMKADRPRAPTSVYGMLKAEAEERLLSLGSSISVLRLSKILAPDLSLVQNWINKLKRGEVVCAFTDLSCAPLGLENVTSAIRTVISERGGGVWQASGSLDVSFADCAFHIARRIGVNTSKIFHDSIVGKDILPEEVLPFTSLDSSRLTRSSGWRSPTLEAVIDQFFPKLEMTI